MEKIFGILQESPPYVVNVAIVWMFLRFLKDMLDKFHDIQRSAQAALTENTRAIGKLEIAMERVATVMADCNTVKK